MQGSNDLRTSSRNGLLDQEVSEENQTMGGIQQQSTLIDRDDNISALCKTVNSDEIKVHNQSYEVEKQSNDMEDLWDFVEPTNQTTDRSSLKNPQNIHHQESFGSTVSSNLISQNRYSINQSMFNFNEQKASNHRPTQIVNNHFREIITEQPPTSVDFPTEAHQTFMRKSSVQLQKTESNLSQTQPIAKPEQLQHKLQLALSKVNESQMMRASYNDQKRSQVREPLLNHERIDQSKIVKRDWQIIDEFNQSNHNQNDICGELVDVSRYSNDDDRDFVDMEFDNYKRIPENGQKASKNELANSNPYYDNSSSVASLDSAVYGSASPQKEIEKLQKQVKQKNYQLAFMAFLMVTLIVVILFQNHAPAEHEPAKVVNKPYQVPYNQTSDREKSILDNIEKMKDQEEKLKGQLKNDLAQLQKQIENMESDLKSVNGDIKKDFERLKKEINEVKERQQENKVDIMDQQKKVAKQTQNGLDKINNGEDDIKKRLDQNQQDTKKIFDDLKDDIDKKLLEHSSDPTIQQPLKSPAVHMPPSKLCSQNEGDYCFCQGKVYYGEKYEYDSYINQKRQITDLRHMLEHPYIQGECADNCMVAYCQPDFFKQSKYKINTFTDMQYVKGTEKQCFCQNFE